MRKPLPRFTDREVLAARGSGPPLAGPALAGHRIAERDQLDPRKPFAMLVEPECDARRKVVDVATIFLTNRECPLRCAMCDLWKHTLTRRVAVGDIPRQIRFALDQLPDASEIKLYNSGNFFDRQAIPPDDYASIADLVRRFDTVVIENHPRLCGQVCSDFRDLIAPAQLEIAIGLETCYEDMLATLNKGMTLSDFDHAVERLHCERIRTRVFLLQSLPFLTESESVEWTLRSMDYAFDRGVDCCSVIPTRSENSLIQALARTGDFVQPSGESIERVASAGIEKDAGRVFVDLWQTERFFPCDVCREKRMARLQQMNLTQQVVPPIECGECGK
ncbi:radical SAM protein [Novipirellula artificiosorum]|uniref:Elp3/MiaA/NifB-like radical SAM core domain-containing protein n=1 Tax=Novipirellula artificiosorum TaxID=2528016 RepID=A0A5C6DEH5_9BACT|nr:radical SAM protein [Novipirellula artificiosorum]TWU33329.1 hypothetical protein Poly41_50830 [Novipirellula artificiosorum]